MNQTTPVAAIPPGTEPSAPDVITGWALSGASTETLQARLAAIAGRIARIRTEYDAQVRIERGNRPSSQARRDAVARKRDLVAEREALELERAGILVELQQRGEVASDGR